MFELSILLAPFLLADIVNPVLFAFMVYAAGTERPLANSSAALIGHTAAYLSFGIILALALESITDRLANPKPIDYGLGLLIGLLLLWAAWRSRSGGGPSQSKSESTRLTPLSAFGFGAIINLIGLPFALPYFAVLDQILKADLTVTDSVTMLVGYNLAYALPFLMVPALVLALGERSPPLLARINQKVDQASAFLMPVLLFLVGVALVLDAIQYFATGKGLF